MSIFIFNVNVCVLSTTMKRPTSQTLYDYLLIENDTYSNVHLSLPNKRTISVYIYTFIIKGLFLIIIGNIYFSRLFSYFFVFFER